MATWVSITSVGARVAGQLERDLRLALSVEPGVHIIPFQFDAAVAEAAPGQVGKTFCAFLARQPGLVGVIWYEMEALGLIEFAPPHLLHVFALAEIAGWSSAQTLTARAEIVGNLLTRRSAGERVTVCAPQTRAFSSIARAMFASKVVDAPIPIVAAARSGTHDEGLSLGIPVDLSPEGWETLVAALTSLSDEARDEEAAPVRVYAPAEFFGSPSFWRLKDVPGISLIEGASPDSHTYAGGDFLIGAASDPHHLDMIARDAAVAGAAVLIAEGETDGRSVRVLDAAGAAAPLTRLRTDPDLRTALREAFHDRAERVAGRSLTFWRSLLLDGRPPGPNGGFEGMVDDAVYSALIDRQALAEETTAARAFLLAPASAQPALDLAGALSRTDLRAAWPLVALANRLARGAEDRPLRPAALDVCLFVADSQGPQYSGGQRAALRRWLAELPAAPREARAPGGKPLGFPNPPSADGPLAYSAGLSPDADGQHKIAAGGALLFVKPEDAPTADGRVIVMEFLLAGEQPAGCLDIEVVGQATQKVDLTSNASRRVGISARAPEDPALGVMIRLHPVDIKWGHVLLTSITEHSLDEHTQARPEALTVIGFDLIETLPTATAVMSGAFGVEPDIDGHDIRWMSRDVVLKLAMAPPEPREDGANVVPWLVLRLRPNPSTQHLPLAADIDLPAPGGKRVTIPMRRLGAFDSDVILGASIRNLESDGIARLVFRSPNAQLSPTDGRLAAACLMDLWVASPSLTEGPPAAPRILAMPASNGRCFSSGWYGVEEVKGLPARWMSREALLSSGVRPRPGSRIFLAVAGPAMPKENPSLAPFTVTFDGRPMAERARVDSPSGWALLFEGETPDNSFGADFQLTAEGTRALGPANSREASILASFAALIDPGAETGEAPGGLGDVEVLNCALTVEHWGGGLSGAWLPHVAIMACARPAGTEALVIEGAAATDVATIKAVAVGIDGGPADTTCAVAQDGSWTLRAPLETESRGAALLLRLRTPRRGRVMLRRVRFE